MSGEDNTGETAPVQADQNLAEDDALDPGEGMSRNPKNPKSNTDVVPGQDMPENEEEDVDDFDLSIDISLSPTRKQKPSTAFAAKKDLGRSMSNATVTSVKSLKRVLASTVPGNFLPNHPYLKEMCFFFNFLYHLTCS